MWVWIARWYDAGSVVFDPVGRCCYAAATMAARRELPRCWLPRRCGRSECRRDYVHRGVGILAQARVLSKTHKLPELRLNLANTHPLRAHTRSNGFLLTKGKNLNKTRKEKYTSLTYTTRVNYTRELTRTRPLRRRSGSK